METMLYNIKRTKTSPLFAASTVKIPFSTIGLWNLRKCWHHWSDHSCEGSQRNPEEGLLSHQRRTQSPWRRLQAGEWWGVEMTGYGSHYLQPRTDHDQGPAVGLLLPDDACVCLLPQQHRYSEQSSCWNPKFPGEKNVPKVSQAQNDELILEGNNIEPVSNSAALIQQATIVINKNIKVVGWYYVFKKTKQFSRLINKI